MRRSIIPLLVAATFLAACVDETPVLPESAPAFSNSASNPTPGTLSLERIGVFDGGAVGAAEITAYDFVSKRVFVVNGSIGTVDVLDLKDPSNPTLIGTIDVSGLGRSANSVDTDRGVVAVAIEANVKTDPGTVAFYRAATLEPISSVTVGALPDMLTFDPSGKRVLVANEGEPNGDYTVDPVGSVSIIDVTNVNAPTVRTVGFASLNGQAAALRAAGVRIFGKPNGVDATVAQDLEPEYIAVSDDGATAFVTLQEANAIARVNIADATLIDVRPLGFKNHKVGTNGIDPSDRDGPDDLIRLWPVFGVYMPDGVDSYTVNGQTYYVTANEGDARAWGSFVEESRVRINTTTTLPLNPAIFTNEACNGGPCTDNDRLGRLTVMTTLGRNPATNQFDALYAFGARSFSIWSSTAQLVWDSKDDLEQRTRNFAFFNASNDNNNFDDRSDNKGPEPESVVLGKLGAKTFAFVGLERTGGVIVYDVTSPTSPFFVTYVNTRTASTLPDFGPEGLVFVPALESPIKEPLLIVGNEVSGTTAVFRINLH